MAIMNMPPSQQPLTVGRIDQLLEEKFLLPSEEDLLKKKRAELVREEETKEATFQKRVIEVRAKQEAGRPPNHIMKYFKYEHLPAHLQGVSKEISELAHLMNDNIPDGPEKTTGLRKLLEAKDCLVRASMEQ